MATAVASAIPAKVTKSDPRINKKTSLTTVNQRYGIQQPVIVVSNGAKCTRCVKCEAGEGYKPHLWRKVCSTCFCPTESHEGAVVQSGGGNEAREPGSQQKENNRAKETKERAASFHEGPTTRERIQQLKHQVPQFDQPILQTASIDSSNSREHIVTVSQGATESTSYVWAPKGLETVEKVAEFMEQLPVDVRPVDSQESQQEWNRMSMKQMPLHDANILSVENPDPERLEFVQKREKAFCEGTVLQVIKQACTHCKKDIEDQNLAVQSDLMPGRSWHPGCFVCKTCREFLVNLAHFIHDGELYCGRHHAELSRPRCGGCDELIFDQEYTLAGGNKWHTHHFCCFYCDKPLGTEEEEYVTHEGQVVCLPCYDEQLAGRCQVCKGKIGAGEHQLSCDNYHWHEECFKCDMCKSGLDADDFMMHDARVYCQDCYSEKFGERCGKCGDVIKGRQVSAMKKNFHPECFTCVDCSIELTGKKFYKRDGNLFCSDCYDKKFSVPCAACNGYVRSQGLRCKSKVYHKDCFKCVKCSISLASCPVIAREDGVYCHNCVKV